MEKNVYDDEFTRNFKASFQNWKQDIFDPESAVRFGKYVEILFSSGQPTGGMISNFLLEKSRVVSQVAANSVQNFQRCK